MTLSKEYEVTPVIPQKWVGSGSENSPAAGKGLTQSGCSRGAMLGLAVSERGSAWLVPYGAVVDLLARRI